MKNHTHIIGAGLAGIACAVALCRAGRRVTLYDAAPHAGGRCRSFHDPLLNATIDNGTHLFLHANRQLRSFLRITGAENRVIRHRAIFPFVHLGPYETPARWRLSLPWGLPLHGVSGLLRLLLLPTSDRSVAECVAPHSALYRRCIEPLTLAVLNTPPETASAALLAASLRRIIASGPRGGDYYLPWRDLSDALIHPALEYLTRHGGRFAPQQRLLAINSQDRRAVALHWAGQDDTVLAQEDAVILAVPPHALGSLLPGIPQPEGYSAIVNAHFACAAPQSAPPLLGILGGVAQWIACKPGMISTTTSAADALAGLPHEELAAMLWRDIRMAFDLAGHTPPPHRIIVEKRATWRATPYNQAQRPDVRTPLRNLFLAGDWTCGALPATLEHAVASGMRAAQQGLAFSGRAP